MNPLLYALPWLAPPLATLPMARRSPDLAKYPPAEDGLVSVIVPARNEAGAIATVVRSILASTYPAFEVIVVDDRSTDATAAIVQALVDEETRSRPGQPARLRLIAGGELPDGWYGKPWACEQGYRAARGNILVFTDADTRHHPELLGHVVGALLAERPGLLTLAPRQLTVTLWERLVMPHFLVMLMIRYHPERINRARRERDLVANGQFILFRRSTYEAIGTHLSVQGEVAEDPTPAQRTALIAAARAVRRRAHAPYSKFTVGAAVLDERGRISLGCNVENASYGLTVCAERNAIAAAVAAGARRIRAVAVATGASPPASPCGACRQVIAELGNADTEVLLAGLKGAPDRTTLGALLPRAFTSF